MGGNTCSICKSEARDAVDQALVAGESLRNIAERTGMSSTSLHRHKKHLKSTLTRANERREIAHEDSVLTQVEAIVKELDGIVHSDLSELVSWGPDGVQMKSSDELPPELTKLVSEVSETRNKDGDITGTKIKLHSKLDAVEKLSKIRGYFTEKVQPDSALDAVITLARLLSDTQLRAMAEGKDSVEGKFEVITSE